MTIALFRLTAGTEQDVCLPTSSENQRPQYLSIIAIVSVALSVVCSRLNVTGFRVLTQNYLSATMLAQSRREFVRQEANAALFTHTEGDTRCVYAFGTLVITAPCTGKLISCRFVVGHF